MNWKGNLKFNNTKVVLICATIFTIITIVMMVVITQDNNTIQEDLPQALNEVLEVDSNELADEVVDKMKAQNIAYSALETKNEDVEDSEVDNEDNTLLHSRILEMQTNSSNDAFEIKELDPYEIIVTDFENIKSGDKNTISRYFSDSDAFSPEIITDKVSATIISFISSEVLEDKSFNVIVHICSLDYNEVLQATKEYKEKLKENEDISEEELGEQVKKEVAKRIVKGDFEVHYNIPVLVDMNGNIKITEEFKQTITGNWYSGIGTNLKEIACVLD